MKYIIVGGGITALSAAFFLKKREPKASITLLEKTNRLGGWMQTSYENGLLFEKGPRTFQLARSPHLMSLIQELDLEVLFSDPAARHRFLLHKNKLRSISSFFPFLLIFLIRELFIPKKEIKDESIYEFACRRFSPKIAELFFDPLTLGVYGGDIKKLSLASCFPTLYAWEQEKGSIVKGMLFSPKKEKGLFTLKGGMQTLISTLEKKLDIEVIFNACVHKYTEKEAFTLDRPYKADRVLIATPPALPKKSIWVVHLSFEEDLKKKGFGYLVPSKEKSSLLGMIFDSVIFPTQGPQGVLRLTAMLRAEEKDPIRKAIQSAKEHLHLHSTPVYSQSFFAKEALLQPEVGLGFQGGVSVDSCIQRGMQLVKLCI